MKNPFALPRLGQVDLGPLSAERQQPTDLRPTLPHSVAAAKRITFRELLAGKATPGQPRPSADGSK